jgi:hypothetical protein
VQTKIFQKSRGNSFTPDDGPDPKTGVFDRWNLPLTENFQRPSILEGIWKTFKAMPFFERLRRKLVDREKLNDHVGG